MSKRIENDKQLRALEAVSYPYLDREGREKVSRKYLPQKPVFSQKQIDNSWDLLRGRKKK